MISQLRSLGRRLKRYVSDVPNPPLQPGGAALSSELNLEIPEAILASGSSDEILAVLDDLNERRELYHSAIIQLKTQIERIRNHKRGLTDFIGQLHSSANISEQEIRTLRRQIGDKEAEVDRMERIFSVLYTNLQEKHSQISSVFASPEYSFLLEKYLQPQSESS